MEPSDQLASLIINEGNDEAGGNFQVKFVPKLPGVYHMSATLKTALDGKGLKMEILSTQ